MRRAVAVVVLAVALTTCAQPARATSKDRVTYESLVERAARGDHAALAELVPVDTVEGRRVDPRHDVAAASRANVRKVLSGGEYETHEPPRPLRGVLGAIGRSLRPIGRPIARVWRWLLDDPRRYVPFAVVLLVVVVASTLRMSRNRSIFTGTRGGRFVPSEPDDPDELERRADERERAGDFDAAVRLRFRAGLLRLDSLGALSYRPSLTAGAAVRAVASPTLATLAVSFDEIAYGGRVAGSDDAAAARSGWEHVLVEARR